MTITRQAVAGRIADYLHHRITQAQLVDWAENALMDGEFDDQDAATISAVVARLGVADVRAFGLTWRIARSFSAVSASPRASTSSPPDGRQVAPAARREKQGGERHGGARSASSPPPGRCSSTPGGACTRKPRSRAASAPSSPT